MDQLNQEQKRLIVGQFYEKHKSKGKVFTVQHFLAMGFKNSTIYDIIQRVEIRKPLKTLVRTGRPAVKMTKKKVSALKQAFDGKTGVSQPKQALRFGISQPYVCQILKRNGIRHFKRKSKPKVTSKQKLIQRQRLIRLSKREFRPKNGLQVVMDDESYFPLTGHNQPGNDSYYSSDPQKVDSDYNSIALVNIFC